MKGVPAPCIKYYAEQHNLTVLDIYKKSCNNEVIKFELTNGGKEFVCRNNKDHTIPNVTDFTRRCQYTRDGSDKFFINYISFYFLIIYNGSNYKKKYMNLISVLLVKRIKKQ